MEMKNENLKTGATETINLSLARYKLCEHMKVHLQQFSRNKTQHYQVFYSISKVADMWNCKEGRTVSSGGKKY